MVVLAMALKFLEESGVSDKDIDKKISEAVNSMENRSMK